MPLKYAHLLKDGNVRRWHENVARGSQLTADVVLRRLGNFCDQNQMTPAQLARLPVKKAGDFLLDTVTRLERQGYAGTYVRNVIIALKSWLSFNGVEVTRRLKIKDADECPTLENERVPAQEELRRIFLAGDHKARAICALLAHAGLRPQVLGSYQGDDGLRLKDLPDLEIGSEEITFKRTPALLRVRRGLSKASHDYFTFLGPEASEYLKAYLEFRLRRGEELGGESAVIVPKTAKNRFITTINIGDAARGAIRKAGFPWRPYVLRSYFATQMMLAESKGLIIRDYRAFFMGHKGDIEAVYTLNKRQLPPEVMEQMRESYAKAQRYLQTSEAAGSQEDMLPAVRRLFMSMAGFKPEEITEERMQLSDEEFRKLALTRLVREVNGNRAGQQVVELSEVEARLAQGWEFVGLLPDNKAIIRQPEAG